MRMTDLHMHTTFCDGKNTPEEMVLAAIEKNMDCIGISAHSYTAFDESYCMRKSDIAAYKAEIARLKEKYRDKIRVLCGIEQDFYSDEPVDGYDYVIGSVHYLKCGEEYLPVDESREYQIEACNRCYGGDFFKMAEAYFETVSQIQNADIIGHIDIITKFNEGFCLFDEENERYIAAYKKAVDKLIGKNAVFEINTGAVSRGYKSTPYPSAQITDYIKSCGGRLILSSDAHSKDNIMFGFDSYYGKKNTGVDFSFRI